MWYEENESVINTKDLIVTFIKKDVKKKIYILMSLIKMMYRNF